MQPAGRVDGLAVISDTRPPGRSPPLATPCPDAARFLLLMSPACSALRSGPRSARRCTPAPDCRHAACTSGPRRKHRPTHPRRPKVGSRECAAFTLHRLLGTSDFVGREDSIGAGTTAKQPVLADSRDGVAYLCLRCDARELERLEDDNSTKTSPQKLQGGRSYRRSQIVVAD